jgi:DNA (cytosine-5)-methyltransferase 1
VRNTTERARVTEVKASRSSQAPNPLALFQILPRRRQPSTSPLDQVVDLFCGAGGLAEGFRMAGFESILGMDKWDAACQTFALAHPTANVAIGDVEAASAKDLLGFSSVAPKELGVICGGPPCQGFSLAGRTITNDPRNNLYLDFLKAVAILRPHWVVMENVPALLTNPTVGASIHSDFQRIDVPKALRYEVRHHVVNAAAYGVPQTRTRVIFVAKRGDVRIKGDFDLERWFAPLFIEGSDNLALFSAPPFVTVDEALSDLPPVKAGEGADEMDYTGDAKTAYQKLMRGELSISGYFKQLGLSAPLRAGRIKKSMKVYNHEAQEHSDLLVERFGNIPPGGSKEDLRRARPDLLPPEGHAEQGLTYGRLWADRPAPTIPANYSRPSGNRSIHPHIPRLITPREAMRLSSFPDSYRLIGGKVAQREQVGNAVPPLLAFHLANAILRVWIR